MTFAIQHPIRKKVNDQKEFIENMIRNYPIMQNLYLEKSVNDIEAEEVRLIEKEADDEIRRSLILSEFGRIDHICNLELDSVFYRSMFLVTYSYFASLIRNMALDKKIPANDSNAFNTLNLILNKENIKLSDEIGHIKCFLNDKIKPFRNDLIHNNGCPRNPEILKQLITDYPQEIAIENGFIDIYGPSVILDTLKKEHILLIELCNLLGYKYLL